MKVENTYATYNENGFLYLEYVWYDPLFFNELHDDVDSLEHPLRQVRCDTSRVALIRFRKTCHEPDK